VGVASSIKQQRRPQINRAADSGFEEAGDDLDTLLDMAMLVLDGTCDSRVEVSPLLPLSLPAAVLGVCRGRLPVLQAVIFLISRNKRFVQLMLLPACCAEAASRSNAVQSNAPQLYQRPFI
jgi:hypothetical protein